MSQFDTDTPISWERLCRRMTRILSNKNMSHVHRLAKVMLELGHETIFRRKSRAVLSRP